LCIGKRVSGQTGHLFWDGGSKIIRTPHRKLFHILFLS
jgi:hypothetical protein